MSSWTDDMNEKDSTVFLTQKGKKGNRSNAHAVEAEEADQLGWARTSHARLLLRKKEMREVNDALELMKDEYHVRMDKCDQREAEFKRKQMDMRYEVMKFEKFIQENDAKRERAEAKARQEHRMMEYKSVELRKLEKELVQAMEEEAKLKGGSERLKRYEDYLKGCSFSDEISDLLTRFRTLRDANVDLTKLCEQRDTSYEKRRSDIQQYRQDKQNEVLVTSSLLNEKQIELEQMRGMVKREEHKAEEEGDRVKGVCRESGQVMLAINNLHSRCKQTKRIRNSGTNDKELDKMAFLERCLHCLHVIGERIEDLREIQGAYGGSWGFPSGAAKATTQSAGNVSLDSRNSLDDPVNRRSKNSTRTVTSARQKPGGSELPPSKGR